MKPTVHGSRREVFGLVGSHIEKHYKRVSVRLTSRDSGVDLMVSDRKGQSTVSIQVKFSKDYLPTAFTAEFQDSLRACSWLTINQDKLSESKADFWVFVLNSFKTHSQHFVVVPARELQRRLCIIHPKAKKTIRSYLWVTEGNRCWDARSLEGGKKDQRRIAAGVYENPVRDFTEFLNERGWDSLMKMLGP
jgi:hypothetical protein